MYVCLIFGQVFSKVGPLRSAVIAKKQDAKKPGTKQRLLLSHCQSWLLYYTGQLLSMGYGFVEFKKAKHAKDALKKLQVALEHNW